MDDEGIRSEILKDPVSFVDGYLEIPDAPGFGVELREDILEKYSYKAWRRGRPTKPDGMLAFI